MEVARCDRKLFILLRRGLMVGGRGENAHPFLKLAGRFVSLQSFFVSLFDLAGGTVEMQLATGGHGDGAQHRRPRLHGEHAGGGEAASLAAGARPMASGCASGQEFVL